MQSTKQNNLLELLAKYMPDSPSQAHLQTQFRDFISANPDCCERTLATGHLTGSAWLVSVDGLRAALMHHAKLGRWLQPGGHADGNADLAGVALREAEEETGLTGLLLTPGIYDLDRHEIPSRGSDPSHWHYDMRFVVRAGSCEQFIQNAESLALAWIPIAELAEREDIDPSIRRMAIRWLSCQA